MRVSRLLRLAQPAAPAMRRRRRRRSAHAFGVPRAPPAADASTRRPRNEAEWIEHEADSFVARGALCCLMGDDDTRPRAAARHSALAESRLPQAPCRRHQDPRRAPSMVTSAQCRRKSETSCERIHRAAQWSPRKAVAKFSSGLTAARAASSSAFRAVRTARICAPRAGCAAREFRGSNPRAMPPRRRLAVPAPPARVASNPRSAAATLAWGNLSARSAASTRR